MKVVASIVGDRVQVEVSAGSLPRYLEMREMATMLAWAEERDLHVVDWMYPSGKVTVDRCKDCNQPIQGHICDWCFQLRRMNGKPDKGALSAEELEYRAQLAESMATKFAQLSIELQARAAQASPDPIEVTFVPSSSLDHLLASMLANFDLVTASGTDLDKLAAHAGLTRSHNGEFTESDSSLRTKIRARLSPKENIAHVDLSAALGIKPGDRLKINNTEVEITKITFSNHGAAEITYRAALPGTINKVLITGDVSV